MTVQDIVTGFFTFCSTMSQTVATLFDYASYVISVNYQLMTSLCSYGVLFITTVFYLLEQIVFTALDVCQHVLDFVTDLLGCVFTLCTLLWKIIMLIYKVLCFVLTGIETLAVCLWTGSLATVTTLKHSAVDVIDTCGVTWNYGVDLSKDFVDTISGGFSMIGTMTISLVKGVFSGLGYCFASLLEFSSNTFSKISDSWDDFTTNLSEMFTFSKEAYLGILLCCLLYLVLSELYKAYRNRGFSFWSGWRRWRRRRRPHRVRNILDIDNDFESDFEEQDYESEENDYISEDNDSVSVIDVTDEEDVNDDETDDEDESEGSLNSQTYSSDGSDDDIEIQLPTPAERYSLRSRSSTPSTVMKDTLSVSEYEVEIEREKDKRKCVVCQDQTKSVLILPCRHMCLCVDCANQIVRSRLLERRICPLCRQRIQKVMNVYV